jgi:hypothetical protein
MIRKWITNELNIPSLGGLLFWAPELAIDAVHELVQSRSALNKQSSGLAGKNTHVCASLL